jgi:polyisoprenoid-binding protein YceI
MSISAWSLLLLWILATAQQPRPPEAGDRDRYIIDTSVGHFTATVGTSGILSAFGHDHTIALREYSGEARLSEDDVEAGALRLSIKAASLEETGKGFSDLDRQNINQDIREQALEVATYPEIVFQSKQLRATQIAAGEYQIDIQGELTLHGVTRSLRVPARVSVQDGTLTAQGEFTVLHRDYRILRLSAAAGTVKASDEIRLSFEIVARKP